MRLVDNNCTGACETGMGCNCHPATYRAPAKAPDQPLVTESGDLSEWEEPQEPSWTHAAAIIALVFLSGAASGAIIYGLVKIA
jgi:hypothetical protein